MFCLQIWVQAFAFLLLGACWPCCIAAARMPASVWPQGVPRYCSFRLGNVTGCGAKIPLDLSGFGGRVCFRMCSIRNWLMCPACHSKMPNLSGEDGLWRQEVRKDDEDTEGSSIGNTVRCARPRVKRIMKKPASK